MSEDKYLGVCPLQGGEERFITCGRAYMERADIRPIPCVRDEHGEIKGRMIKQFFAKIDEELNELKSAILTTMYEEALNMEADVYRSMLGTDDQKRIAEEAADTITAITTMLEATGIGEAMRDEAQRRVNSKNRERGRL